MSADELNCVTSPVSPKTAVLLLMVTTGGTLSGIVPGIRE